MTSKLSIWSTVAMSVAATACLSCGQPAFGQDEADTRLGNVHFATSCNETAQRRFDRAMRYQHSFWYRRSKGSSRRRSRPIPNAGSRIGSVALSLLNNPHNPPPAPISRSGSPPSRRRRRSAPRPNASAISSTRCRCSIPITTRSAWRASAALSQGDGGGGAAQSRRRRSAAVLRHHAQCRASPATRPIQSTQGRGDPGADLQAPAAIRASPTI